MSSPAPTYHLAPARVLEALFQVQRRIWAWWWQRTTRLAGGVGIIGLTTILLWASRSLAPASRLRMWTGAWVSGVVLICVSVGWVWPRRRYRTPRQIARYVARVTPALGGDVQSAVELIMHPHGSVELRQRFMAEIAQRLSELPPQALLSTARLRTATRLLWLSLAVLPSWALTPRLRTGLTRLTSFAAPAQPPARQLAEPLLGNLEFTLQFPSYMRRAPLRLSGATGELRAPVGTVVSFTGQLLGNYRDLSLVIEAGGTQRITQVSTLHGSALGQFEILQTGTYWFGAMTPAHTRVAEALRRSIEAIPDRPPSVTLTVPAPTLQTSGLAQIELAYAAEDDLGLSSLTLAWRAGKDGGAIALTAPQGRQSQGKYIWDLSTLSLPGHTQLEYWLEARDNAPTPGLGRSHTYQLEITSARERHEQTLRAHRQLITNGVELLAARLRPTVPLLGPPLVQDGGTQRRELLRRATLFTTQLGALHARYEADTYASQGLRTTLANVRDQLTRLETQERALLDSSSRELAKARPPLARVLPLDARWVAALEDGLDQLLVWYDREQLEAMLDLGDEAEQHQARLQALLEANPATSSPSHKAEIERALRALRAAMLALDQQQHAIPQDVLDQFVQPDALASEPRATCVDRALAELGPNPQLSRTTRERLQRCLESLRGQRAAMESSLDEFQSERFAQEHLAFEQLRNELAELSQNQAEIAKQANALHRAYADAVAQRMREIRVDATKPLWPTLERLERMLELVPQQGLTPFSSDELELAAHRLADVRKAMREQDLAEAAAMSRHVSRSLVAIVEELSAAIEEAPRSSYNTQTLAAIEAIRRANRLAKELSEAFARHAPTSRELLSADQRAAFATARRRQTSARGQLARLLDLVKKLQAQMPPQTAHALRSRLDGAHEAMRNAEGHLQALEPLPSRETTEQAARLLATAEQRGRDAARQRQPELAHETTPIRIPGRDEFRPPSTFREDVLKAMQRRTPGSYAEMVKLYYEELIR